MKLSEGKIDKKNIIIWGIFITLQYLLFRSAVERDVIEIIPLDVDQAVYMTISYNFYDLISKHDFLGAIAYLKVFANGGFPILGTLLLYVLGYSKISLLSLNFCLMILFEIAMNKLVKKITDSDLLGFVAGILILACNTVYAWTGDLLSYRTDFSVMCLYGIWLVISVYGIYMKNRKVYFASGIVAGLLVFCRFIYAPIVGLVIVCYQFFGLLRYKQKNIIKNIIIYGLIVIISGGWLFFLNIVEVWKYYYIGANNSELSALWCMNMPIVQNLLYYIKWLGSFHLGKLAIGLMIGYSILTILCMVKWKIRFSIEVKATIVFLTIAMLVPYTIFTIDESKQYLVISILVVALICCLMVCVADVYKQLVRNNGEMGCKIICIGAVLIITTSAFFYCYNITGVHNGGYISDGKVQWERLENIVDYSMTSDIKTVRILTERPDANFVQGVNINLVSYEKYGKKISYEEAVLTKDNINDLYSILDSQDVICMAVNDDVYEIEPLTTHDKLFSEYREKIWNYATENMVLLNVGSGIDIFVRSQVNVISKYSDWLTPNQNYIEVNKLDNESEVILSGTYTNYEKLDVRCIYDGKELPVTVMLCDDNCRYSIMVDISSLENGKSVCELQIEQYYIPSENSDSVDIRKSSIMYPDELEIK